MFSAFELGALIVETLLMNLAVPYRKPYVIRLVFILDPFTKLGIRLDVPSTTFLS